jgi:hypothetical protein
MDADTSADERSPTRTGLDVGFIPVSVPSPS